MRARSSLVTCIAAACSVACTSTYAEIPTITRPATEPLGGTWFATFTITQNCSEGCPIPWHRLSKKVDGQWEVQFTGCGAPLTQTMDLDLDPGEYMLEGVCYNDTDESNPPQSGWQVCAYLISWRATIEVRRKGSTGSWSGGTNVAAGGKDPDVHKADIRVAANPPVAGLEVSVSIPDGYGEGSTLTACPAALSPDPATLTTGSDGIATATFTSSNKIENVPIKLKPAGVDHEFGSATVNQRWDHEDGGEWEYEQYFVPEVAHPVSLKLELADGPDLVPISGHTVKFYAWKVVYYEWDDSTEQFEPQEETIGADNFWDLSHFCVFNAPSTQDSGNTGVYSTAMTVKDDLYWYVDEVYFWGIDDCVYE